MRRLPKVLYLPVHAHEIMNVELSLVLCVRAWFQKVSKDMDTLLRRAGNPKSRDELDLVLFGFPVGAVPHVPKDWRFSDCTDCGKPCCFSPKFKCAGRACVTCTLAHIESDAVERERSIEETIENARCLSWERGMRREPFAKSVPDWDALLCAPHFLGGGLEAPAVVVVANPLSRVVDYGKRSVVHCAAESGDVVALEAFLRIWPQSISFTDGSGRTPLFAAITGKVLIPTGADIDIPRDRPVKDLTPQAIASVVQLCIDGRKSGLEIGLESNRDLKRVAECIRFLLSHKANVNGCLYDGISPLHLVGRLGLSHLVSTLLEFNANLEARDTVGRRPLHEAALAGYADVVKIFLAAGAKLKPDTRGCTPFHAATSGVNDKGSCQVLRLLMEHKDAKDCFDVNDKECATPLRHAVGANMTECVDFLLEHKAQMHLSAMGYTILFGAIRHGLPDMAKRLIAAGTCTHETYVFPFRNVVGKPCMFDVDTLSNMVAALLGKQWPKVRKHWAWLEAKQTKCRTRCALCGFDPSPSAARAYFTTFARTMLSLQQNACANPACKGERRPALTLDGKIAMQTMQARTKKCSRCVLTAYCSPECQRAHWPVHKPMCVPSPLAADALSPMLADKPKIDTVVSVRPMCTST
jgi:hypothetical protein